MNDTTPQITAKMSEMIRKKTPEQRLVMGCSMYDFSKKLVTNSILRENPDISAANLRREVFLRFYGNVLEQGKQEQFLAYLKGQGNESAVHKKI